MSDPETKGCTVEKKLNDAELSAYMRGMQLGKTTERAVIVSAIRARANAQRSLTYKETLNDIARRLEDGRL